MNSKPIRHLFSALFLLATLAVLPLHGESTTKQASQPNILFIAVDDLNDWIGPMGGNKQVKTPHLDKFAKGALCFQKAYCPATVCGPSRSALLTGKQCSNTGVYGNGNDLKIAPKTQNLETLPEYFGNRGYATLSRGKIFHKQATAKGMDEGQWAFQEWSDTSGEGGLLWEVKPTLDGIVAGGSDFVWGAIKAPLEKTSDYQTCEWGVQQLQRDFGGKPFFMAIGISKPHLPFYAPQEFFDMYPLDQVKIAPVKRDDLDDILDSKGRPIHKMNERFELAEGNNMHKEANRAYMACISYVDACLGHLLENLEKSVYGKNTIVVIWGDHGWHLGEKLKYGKTGLWEESARVPLLIKVPGEQAPNGDCNGVVNLLDLYPTLVEVCGLPKNPENDGKSFAPLLSDPNLTWNDITLTTYQYKNHSMTDGRYRYIQNHQKSGEIVEEFYDHQNDPLEHNNLATNPELKQIMDKFRKVLPSHDEPESPKAKFDKKQLKEDRKNKNKKKSDSTNSEEE
jgi:arylsulfatase A-like enzyme